MGGRFRVTGPVGERHTLVINVEMDGDQITVEAVYESGSLQIPHGTVIANWEADFEGPDPTCEYEGQLDIGQGRRDIAIDGLRGIGLGSFLMSFIIKWAHSRPDVPVVEIILSAADANSEVARQRRNRFWEKLGFRFDYYDGNTWGTSRPLRSRELIDPGLRFAKGWEFQQI